ncbi:MAG: hypothetical protein JRN37_08515 [Nitrososphaerota archaeon]|nr:hypothetical protein [Nitrososphaerota archaeon]MDG7041248.1 hypothetical protein [Nitrososphaerota archaeon]MDG7043325.1 hypothetical protein [Nitrososphaerota archaeon]
MGRFVLERRILLQIGRIDHSRDRAVQNSQKRKHWLPQAGSKSALLEGNVNRQTRLADFS